MKIALIGYGKMGHMIEQIALERGHEIVCKIDIDNADDFDSPAFASADVAIEFTNPTAAYGNYLRAFKHNVKVVSGSTGWMKDHKADVEALCQDGKQTLFWASNFSVGVAIFQGIDELILRYTESTAFHLHAPHAYVKAIMAAGVKPGPTSSRPSANPHPAAPGAQP